MYKKIKVKVITEEDYNKLINFLDNNTEKYERVYPLRKSTTFLSMEGYVKDNNFNFTIDPIWFIFTEDLYGKSIYRIILTSDVDTSDLKNPFTELFKSHQEVTIDAFMRLVNEPPEEVSDFFIRTNKGEYEKQHTICFFKLNNEVSGEFVIPEDWSMIRLVQFINSFDKNFV